MIRIDGGVLYLEGDFNHHTAPALLAEGERVVAAQDCVVDFSAVTAVDSSAVAVVIGWMRTAREAGHSLRLASPPAAFLSLASLYSVSELVYPESGSLAREHL